jgi:hypothetical protein
MPPRLSIVVILHWARCKAQRTLQSLSPSYQRGIAASEYEVLVVDKGGESATAEAFVHGFGSNFHYYQDQNWSSDAEALNWGVRQSHTRYIGVLIHCADILTPHVLDYAKRLTDSVDCPIIALRRFLIAQNLSVPHERSEGEGLLERNGWLEDPYRMFEVSLFMGKERLGWFGQMWDSAFLALPRDVFESIGGCDERFDVPTSGLLGPDLFARAVTYPQAQVYALLGEGSFIQGDHDVTNLDLIQQENTRYHAFLAHYERIYGRSYDDPELTLEFLGSANPRSFLV